LTTAAEFGRVETQEREKDERHEHPYNARPTEEYSDQTGNLYSSRGKRWLQKVD
jgi:hypothetical protein